MPHPLPRRSVPGEWACRLTARTEGAVRPPRRLYGIGDLERDTVQGAGTACPTPAAAQPALLPLTIIEIYS